MNKNKYPTTAFSPGRAEFGLFRDVPVVVPTTGRKEPWLATAWRLYKSDLKTAGRWAVWGVADVVVWVAAVAISWQFRSDDKDIAFFGTGLPILMGWTILPLATWIYKELRKAVKNVNTHRRIL